jgi:nucleotide-binding universal stress UspA family protein
VYGGTPIDCILRRVRETGTDLLVLGLTGSSMIPMGAGTLATKCLRKAPTKVMLVHEGHAGSFRSVVACVDLSEQSREAVVQALRVAAQDGSQVHFLHVFTGSWGRYALVPDAWEVNEAKAAQCRRALEQRLREFVGETAGRLSWFAVVEAANHGHGIAEYTRRVGVNLVVLGTKGRSNLSLIFAVDSIPAIFAVTTDPFIVYTSNVFAILGLRSLYFALAGVMDKFHYLKIGLGVVLSFVGVKMLLAHTAYKLNTLVSLGVVVLILATSIVMSLLRPRKLGEFVGPTGPMALSNPTNTSSGSTATQSV